MENFEIVQKLEEMQGQIEAIEKILRRVEIIAQLTHERIGKFDIKKSKIKESEVSFAPSYAKDIFSEEPESSKQESRQPKYLENSLKFLDKIRQKNEELQKQKKKLKIDEKIKEKEMCVEDSETE